MSDTSTSNITETVSSDVINSQLKVMFELQDKMNSRVNEDWRSQGFAWYRAIWTECAETLDHYGWKWWKKQTPDRDQVLMELVDIWHFGLSIILLEGRDSDQVVDQLNSSFSVSETQDFRELLEDFTAATLVSKSFDVQKFGRLMAAVDMTTDDLYAQYIGKNVLNFFRQDHGYKAGSYIKIWHGKEDNEHLVEALDKMSPSSDRFADELYAELESRYPQ